MNELRVFKDSRFGELRTTVIDGQVWFCAVDVATSLGYAKPHGAIARHCRHSLKRGVPTNSGIQDMIFIPRGDIYRMAAHSKLDGAEDFENWIFDDVVPTVMETGSYSLTNQPLSSAQLLAETTKALAQQAEIILDLDQRVTALTDKANALTEQTAVLTSRMDNAVRVFSRPNTIGEWKIDTEMAIRAMSSSIAFRGRLYAELDTRAGCNLSARLTRTRNRARKNGLTLAQAKAINKLDVIAADKHLRNIFDGIIREHQAVYVAGYGENVQAVIDAEFVEVN